VIRFSAYFLVFFLSIFNAEAQDCAGSVKGIVLDETGEPLPQAAITLGATHTVSSVAGSFEFRGLCPGEYLIEVTFVGYEPQQVNVRVPLVRMLEIQLVPSSTELQSIVIEGAKANHGASQAAALLEENELEALHGKPLGESLKEIPGVNALQTGPSIFKPVIDGLHSQRILILNNGIRQEGQQWGIEHAPEVDPFIASSIQVVKGAETVRYGSAAMGGVIIINPPPLHMTDKIGGEVNTGIMSNNRMAVFSAMVEGSLLAGSGWSWRLQGSMKKGGDYHAPKHNLSNTGVHEFNFSGALGYEDERRGAEI
jgi:iron complex outermembrane receptor protein